MTTMLVVSITALAAVDSTPPPLSALALHHIPERSHSFLVRAIESAIAQKTTVNVLLLLGNQRYDLGTFVVEQYQLPSHPHG